MYVQGVDSVFDLDFNGGEGQGQGHLWRRLPPGRAGIFPLQFRARRHRSSCSSISATPRPNARRCSPRGDDGERHLMALPAYDQAIKASHIFNLLDARGVISVTERQATSCACAISPRPAAPRGSRPRLAAPMLEAYRDADAPPQSSHACAEAEAPILDRPGVALDADQLPADAEARCQSCRSPRSRTPTCARRCRRSPPTSPAFALYLDYTAREHLPVSWAVGAFYVEQGKGAFMRFYDFLDTVPRMCWCRSCRPPAPSQI